MVRPEAGGYAPHMASHDEPEAERLRERVAELERQLQAMRQSFVQPDDSSSRRTPPPMPGEALDDDGERSTPELQRELAALRARVGRLELLLSERARRGRDDPATAMAQPRDFAAASPAMAESGHRLAPPTVRPLPQVTAAALERFVGGRLIAWLGAFVLIAAFGIFGHLAYTRGWFAFLTPSTRLAVAYAASLGLLLVAEALRRRLGRAASVGCAAGGIAGLYVTTAVGVALQVIASPEIGLLAATAAAAIGLLATLWFDSLAIATIALLGGYVAPIFAPGFPFTEPSDSPLVLAVHLTVCLVVGFVPSLLRHARFHHLRMAAVILQTIFGAAWLFGPADMEPTITLLFVSVWWSMAMGESMIAAMRGHSRRENQVVVITATVPAASVVALIVGEITPWASPLAYTPLLMAALSFVGSLTLPKVEVACCDSDEERSIAIASRGLAVTLRLLSVLLLALGVSPFLGDTALAIAWSFAAVAVVESERRGLIAGGRWGGLILLLGAWLTGCAAMIAGRGSATTVSLASLLPVLLAGMGTIALSFAQLGLLSAVVAGIAAVRRTLDHVVIARGLLALVAALAWSTLALSSARDWSAVLLLTLMPVAFAFGRRVPVPGIGIVATMLVATLWSIIKIDLELLAIEPRLPTVGVDILLAAALVAAGSIATTRLRSVAARALAQIAVAVMIAAFAAVLTVTYLRWAGIGDHPSDRIGLAAAIITVVAAAMLRFALERRAAALLVAAAVELFLATGLWIVATLIGGSLTWGASDGWPLANIGTVAGAVIAASLVVAWRALQRGHGDETHDGPWRWTSMMATAMSAAVAGSLLAGLSREVSRVVAYADPALASPVLSVLWGSCGIALIAIGFVRRAAVLRWVGLGALAVVAVKVLAWDMRGTDTLLRVAMLVGIGVLLVVASVLYARRAAQESVQPQSHGGDATP